MPTTLGILGGVVVVFEAVVVWCVAVAVVVFGVVVVWAVAAMVMAARRAIEESLAVIMVPV